MAVYQLGDKSPEFGEGSWVAENAVVVGDVHGGRNVSIWYNAVIRADNAPMIIGDNTNIQDGAVFHVDPDVPLTLGNNVTVGHMVMLHGCTVGNGSLIGIGSVVLNRAVIGKNCLIGAKSLIPEGRAIPDNSLVMGAPAKVVRTLTDEEVQSMLQWVPGHYVDNARRHQNTAREITDWIIR